MISWAQGRGKYVLLPGEMGEDAGQLVLVQGSLTKIHNRTLRSSGTGTGTGSSSPDTQHSVDRVDREQGQLLGIRRREGIGLLSTCEVHCLKQPESSCQILWVCLGSLRNLQRRLGLTRLRLTRLGLTRLRLTRLETRWLCWVELISTASTTTPTTITIGVSLKRRPRGSSRHLVN